MKHKYWIPFIGLFLMPDRTYRFLQGQIDKEAVFAMWCVYQWLISCILIGGAFIYLFQGN